MQTGFNWMGLQKIKLKILIITNKYVIDLNCPISLYAYRLFKLITHSWYDLNGCYTSIFFKKIENFERFFYYEFELFCFKRNLKLKQMFKQYKKI